MSDEIKELAKRLRHSADTIDGFEGRGDYVTYVSFSLDTRKAAKHCGGDA